MMHTEKLSIANQNTPPPRKLGNCCYCSKTELPYWCEYTPREVLRLLQQQNSPPGVFTAVATRGFSGKCSRVPAPPPNRNEKVFIASVFFIIAVVIQQQKSHPVHTHRNTEHQQQRGTNHEEVCLLWPSTLQQYVSPS